MSSVSTFNEAPGTGSAGSSGFTNRAKKIISNAALYTLIEDMARTIDVEMPRINNSLDAIKRHLGIEDKS